MRIYIFNEIIIILKIKTKIEKKKIKIIKLKLKKLQHDVNILKQPFQLFHCLIFVCSTFFFGVSK